MFANAELLLGEGPGGLETTIIPEYKGFLIMALPPGGFLVLVFLVAGKRIVDRKLAQRKPTATVVESVLPDGA